MPTPNTDRPPKVLVMGRGNRSLLSVARSLGRKGIEVHVSGCDPDDLALKSRYVRGYHRLPTFRIDDADPWATQFEQLLQQQPFDLVIPTNDPSILPLEHFRGRFDSLTTIYLVNADAAKIVNDKVQVNQIAAGLGIPLPQEEQITDFQAADRFADRCALPLVFKPTQSVTVNDLRRKHAVRVIRSHEQLETAVREMLPVGPVVVQQYFCGVGLGVEVLAKDGEILVAFQHRRLHEALGGGQSTYRVSEPLDEGLLSAARKLMAALSYTGVAMLEFKRNDQSGDWIFVELNARFWGSLPLALASGADFPFCLYSMIKHGQTEFSQKYRTGVYCRDLGKDLKWQVRNLRADHSDPTQHTVARLKVLSEPLHWLIGREHVDSFTLDDPKPGLVGAARYIGEIGSRVRWVFDRKIVRRKSWVRRHAADATRRLATAQRFLFVCKGNVCRSPFAAELLNSNSELTASSAGYLDRGPRPSPNNAVAAAEAFGIDLTPHRAQVVTAGLLDDADVVVTFDEHNYLTLLTRFRPYRQKLVRLDCLAESEQDRSLDDPWGKDVDFFRRIYQRIERNLRASVPGFSSHTEDAASSKTIFVDQSDASRLRALIKGHHR